MELLKLENGMLMQCYDSDNCLYEDGNNSCIGYCLFNEDGSYEDGGEFDYNSDDYLTEDEVLKYVIDFATGETMDFTVIADTSDCSYETFDELLEELDPKDLNNLADHLTDPSLIMKVKEKCLQEILNRKGR